MPEAISVVCCRAGRVSERDVPALRSAGGDLSRDSLSLSFWRVVWVSGLGNVWTRCFQYNGSDWVALGQVFLHYRNSHCSEDWVDLHILFLPQILWR